MKKEIFKNILKVLKRIQKKCPFAKMDKNVSFTKKWVKNLVKFLGSEKFFKNIVKVLKRIRKVFLQKWVKM